MPTALPLANPQATDAFGQALASAIVAQRAGIAQRGLQLNLSGELGAGKTALVRALLRALGVGGPVKSPTFALLEPYAVSSLDFYHFDFYRLQNPAEFESLGFRDLFGAGRVCAVEWPERAGTRLPVADISIELTVQGDGRLATASTGTEVGSACLSEVMRHMQVGGGGSSPPALARSSSP